MDVPSGGAIEFQGTFVENATRAAQTVTTANLDAFQVWGFVNAPTGVVFEETTVSKNGGAWSYDGTQYWAPDQHYYFAAVAPLSDLWSLNTETADVTGPGVLSFTNDAATDLVYAEKHVQAAGAGQVNPAVALQFQHLLSKVKLTFTNSFGIDNYKVALNGIKMTTPESAVIDLRDEHTWKEFGADMTLAFTSKELANNMTEATVEEYFILPTACGIQFDLQIYVGTEKVYKGTKTATLPADAFEMGHAYNLSAEINADVLNFDEIVFTVDKVEEWVEAPNASDAAANLLYAAQMGGVITLEEDVVLDAPVVVPEGVELVLNLNGKTIKNTTQSEVYGEGEGIIAYGDLTINGEGGTVEASTMAVWARGNDGAKVTINGGTYKGCAEGFAKGGRSVIYASSGNTIDIYGGTFQALAADKTSYANKTEGVYAAVNVADNNGNINVYGGTFVGQNPAAPGTEPAAWNAAHPNGFVAPYYKSTEDNGVWTVALDAIYTTAELQAAINAGQSHINLAPGVTFDGTVYMKSNVTIEGLAGATMHSLNLNGASNVTLKNITFDAAGATMAYGGDNKVRFMANIVSRDQSNSSKVAGAQDVVISGCTFTGKFTNGGMAICFSDQTKTGSGNITIEDCTFDTLGSYADIYGYYFGNKNNLVIKGNTFKSANSNPPVYLGRYASSVPVVVKNNHFATVTSLAKAVTLQAHGTSYTVSIDAENNTFAE